MDLSQRVEFLPVTTLFFWKICFSFRTSWKELIWCTNDPNVHICIFRKRLSSILGWFFLWVSLKEIQWKQFSLEIRRIHKTFIFRRSYLHSITSWVKRVMHLGILVDLFPWCHYYFPKGWFNFPFPFPSSLHFSSAHFNFLNYVVPPLSSICTTTISL